MPSDQLHSPQLVHAAGQKPRVLIVDDNRDFAENIAEVVEDLGYSAEVAFTGGEAIEAFVRNPFGAAVIDLQLPDLSGTRVIARLKEIGPECVCIVFTGNATLHNAVDALNRGAFAYLAKGGEVNEFRAVLAKAIEAHGVAAELRQIRGINQAVLENFPGRMLILDEEGRILLSNRYPLPLSRAPQERLTADPVDGLAGRRIEDAFPPSQPWCAEILDHYALHRAATVPSILPRLSGYNLSLSD
jgi:ActR/RegA family two-component response regulator